ncbi:DNA-binding transcriptional regulator NagC [Providencia burhodogranariea]|uniref:DNA-binding transcriptional dual regulator NagC n=1 Tax=Providencia burhodogranariea DSM 19968 TaxID=1141662 RepID=K8WW67_9GAMM|nr:ROK family protein [Providencia burhodogranariea]EKT61667.1 DNA-binding transcriptional dual regulator NagC [Providencia burhodogranariea DSM 19968]
MNHSHSLKQIGNIDLVKQLNSAVVYSLIDQQGPISRIQIAEHSQLAPASVTKITRQLLERGLIKEVDQQASTGGRRAISIVSEYKNFHTIGVRLGRYDATIALYDLSGKLLIDAHYPLSELSQQAVEQKLIAAIEDFITFNQRRIKELIAISVILPGLVNPHNGIVHYMPHIKVDNWHLVDNLKAHFQLTCYVGHDIRSLALAECYFGATRDCEDSLLVRIHRGAGAGLVINKEILLNRRGNLGEIGHIQVDPLGDLCHCGNFGCLETIASNQAIENRVKQRLEQGFTSSLTPEECSIHHICQAANKNDPLATEVIQHVGRQIGKAVAISINLFNPEKVVIAGDITEADQILLPAIQSCIDTQALKGFRDNLPVVTSQLVHNSAIGAFALTKRAMLNGELLQKLLDS